MKWPLGCDLVNTQVTRIHQLKSIDGSTNSKLKVKPKQVHTTSNGACTNTCYNTDTLI